MLKTVAVPFLETISADISFRRPSTTHDLVSPLPSQTRLLTLYGICVSCILLRLSGGAWVAQSVVCLTLGFRLGHDLTVLGFEPCIGLCTDSVESAWDSFSLSLCPSRALFPSQNKIKKLIQKKKKKKVVPSPSLDLYS